MSTGNLPPALLARLARRGIVPGSGSSQSREQEPEEEVIAEDYDDPNALKGNGGDMCPGCPNKYNIYHDCNEYCFKVWGSGLTCPVPDIERRYNNLLKKHPLPMDWKKVWEPGVMRYYFWNTYTDEVSWYPPSHPAAKISFSVSKLKAQLKEEEQVLESMSLDDDVDSSDLDLDISSDDSTDSDEEPRKKQKLPHSRSSPQPHF